VGGVEVEEVEGELFEDGEIMGGMVGMSAHRVVGEDDVPAPVEAVLDVPALPDGGREAEGVRGRAGEGEAFGTMQTVEGVEGIRTCS
jgi:hypothetical protein